MLVVSHPAPASGFREGSPAVHGLGRRKSCSEHVEGIQGAVALFIGTELLGQGALAALLRARNHQEPARLADQRALGGAAEVTGGPICW